MIDPDLKDLWTPAGLILGFQVTLFKWRLERESEVGDKGDIPWLVPSDYISGGARALQTRTQASALKAIN